MIDARIDANRNAKGFIFDGFPRTTAQAEVLDKLLAQKNTSISMMLSLEVPKEELIKRLLNRGKDSGRADDSNQSIIENRISEYNNKTAPLKDYYSEQGKFFGIQGVGTVDEIFDSICRQVEKK
jgi:adenylate kinase